MKCGSSCQPLTHLLTVCTPNINDCKEARKRFRASQKRKLEIALDEFLSRNGRVVIRKQQMKKATLMNWSPCLCFCCLAGLTAPFFSVFHESHDEWSSNGIGATGPMLYLSLWNAMLTVL